jgi:hypothetical protein
LLAGFVGPEPREQAVKFIHRPLQQPYLLQSLPENAAHPCLHALGGFGDGEERCWHHCLRFVEVSQVVDEGELLAGVDKAQAGAVAGGDDGCVAKAIEKGCSCR